MKTKFVAVCVVAVTLALILQETDGIGGTIRKSPRVSGYKRSKVKLELNIAKKKKKKTNYNKKKTKKQKTKKTTHNHKKIIIITGSRKMLIGMKRAKPQKSVSVDLSENRFLTNTLNLKGHCHV